MDELAAPLPHRSLLPFQLSPLRPLLPSVFIPGPFRHSITTTDDDYSGQLGRVTVDSIEPPSVTVTVLSPVAFWRTWRLRQRALSTSKAESSRNSLDVEFSTCMGASVVIHRLETATPIPMAGGLLSSLLGLHPHHPSLPSLSSQAQILQPLDSFFSNGNLSDIPTMIYHHDLCRSRKPFNQAIYRVARSQPASQSRDSWSSPTAARISTLRVHFQMTSLTAPPTAGDFQH